MNSAKNIFSMFSAYLLMSLMVGGMFVSANAQKRNDRDTRDIVRSLRSKIDDFQYNLTYQLKNNSADQSEVAEIDGDLRDLTAKINDFENNLDRKRENRDDVSKILDSAQTVSAYLDQNRQNRRFQTDWTSINNLLNRLAVSYNVQANGGGYNNQTGGNYPNNNQSRQTNSNSYGLTGTYQLDVSQSDKSADVIADTSVENDDQRRDLQNKLDAPEQIAIEVRGNQIRLASSNSPQSSLNADGRDLTTTGANGAQIRLRATLNGQQLTVTGDDGATNYSATFVSENNGQTLKVSRRITTDYLDQTVFADSVYRKTENIARLDIGNNSGTTRTDVYSKNDQNNNSTNDNNGNYSTNDSTDRNGSNNQPNNGNYPPTANRRTGSFVVPNGTIISGILNNDINTKLSQNNDRFKMTVQSPDEYRGAVIEGYIAGINRSGKVSGRSQIAFNFERITLRSGQTYDFAGNLQNIKDLSGRDVKVDAEGTAQGGNQTKQTIKRGGIGAGIGAVIGAIAGGGTGAAIGAVIGGGAGAGSVIVQGNNDLELKQGSSITVQASSPLR